MNAEVKRGNLPDDQPLFSNGKSAAPDFLIENVQIHPGNQKGFAGSLLMRNGKIEEIFRELHPKLSASIKRMDAGGAHLLPGLIDVHLHGGYGYDFIEHAAQAVRKVAEKLPAEGTTGFLASLTVIDHSSMLSLLQEYSALWNEQPSADKGACFLGVHSEGPYLSQNYKALMDPLCLRDPSSEEFLQMKQAAGGSLKVMTIACERQGALEMIRNEKTAQNSVVFMIGHSAASCKEAQAGLAAGALGFTHLYNAMSAHTHRQPGCVTAALLDDHALCELIADGFHVHPDVLRLTWKVLGPERIVLITDAMPGKGMPDGSYLFSNLDCVKSGNTVRVRETGRIAGSAVTMLDVLHTMHHECDASLDDLARMGAYNPALAAGVRSAKGSIEKGKDADLILLDDNLELLQTWIDGTTVWSR